MQVAISLNSVWKKNQIKNSKLSKWICQTATKFQIIWQIILFID